MKRLTNKDGVLISGISKAGKNTECKEETGLYSKDLLEEVIYRLADYEDTGLSPEEVIALKAENERLKKIEDIFQSIPHDCTIAEFIEQRMKTHPEEFIIEDPCICGHEGEEGDPNFLTEEMIKTDTNRKDYEGHPDPCGTPGIRGEDGKGKMRRKKIKNLPKVCRVNRHNGTCENWCQLFDNCTIKRTRVYVCEHPNLGKGDICETYDKGLCPAADDMETGKCLFAKSITSTSGYECRNKELEEKQK